MNIMKRIFAQLVVLSVVFSVSVISSGCTRKGDSAQSSAGKKIVNLAIWSAYLPPQQIAEFEKKTGIDLRISNFSSNEELLAKLQAGASGYDVIVPSDYMVYAMAKLKLLRELDYSQLSNAKFLDPKLMKRSYDPENKFSVPFAWGTSGIAVNRSLYSGTIKGWKDFFEKTDFAGRVSLLDDSREVLGAALKSLGYSINSKNPEEIKKAKAVILGARSRIKAFSSEPKMPLINGEFAVAHVFSTEALQARERTGGKVDYILPVEGGVLWVDNLAIPTGAQHIKEAYELIDYMIDAATAAAVVKNVRAGPTNKNTMSLLSPELQNDPAIFPTEAVMSKFEMLEDLGDFLPVVDRSWTEIKADSR